MSCILAEPAIFSPRKYEFEVSTGFSLFLDPRSIAFFLLPLEVGFVDYNRLPHRVCPPELLELIAVEPVQIGTGATVFDVTTSTLATLNSHPQNPPSTLIFKLDSDFSTLHIYTIALPNMRFRVRGPSGQSTVTLDETATIKDLRGQIAEKTGLTSFDVKYGYPNLKPLEIDSLQPDQGISELGVNLNGEQLIVAQRESATPQHHSVPNPSSSSQQIPPPSTSSKKPESSADDPPEVPSPDHAGTFVLRVMPDDNSCLFRAVGAAVMGDMDTMVELRSIVAGAIQSNPTEYTAAILGKNPDDYCKWIQNEDSWGGAIELKILSEYFNIEICSIDVQTLHMFQFNEGAPTRCIVVYSGIHYDVLALSPSDPPYTHADPLAQIDTKIFEAVDPVVLEKAKEVCRVLQSKHYYTDTSGFLVRCNTCGETFTGEKGAVQHATATGHYDFGESG